MSLTLPIDFLAHRHGIRLHGRHTIEEQELRRDPNYATTRSESIGRFNPLKAELEAGRCENRELRWKISRLQSKVDSLADKLNTIGGLCVGARAPC
jgi:hypothetical protein